MTQKKAHPIWELRKAEDNAGGFVLVRTQDERAVDMREASVSQDLAKKEAGLLRAGTRVAALKRGQFMNGIVVKVVPSTGDAKIDFVDGTSAVIPLTQLFQPGTSVLSDDTGMGSAPEGGPSESTTVEVEEVPINDEEAPQEADASPGDIEDVIELLGDPFSPDMEPSSIKADEGYSNSYGEGKEEEDSASSEPAIINEEEEEKEESAHQKEAKSPAPTLSENISRGMLPGAKVYDPSNDLMQYTMEGYSPVRGPSGVTDYQVRLQPEGGGQPLTKSFQNEVSKWHYTTPPQQPEEEEEDFTPSRPSVSQTGPMSSNMPTSVMRAPPKQRSIQEDTPLPSTVVKRPQRLR